MSETSKKRHMQSSSAVFFITLYSMQYILWLIKWLGPARHDCVLDMPRNIKWVQVLPKHKLLVKQMSSWHLDKSPYCCNWKGKRGTYNELQRYTYWLSCCSAPVYAEEAGLALPKHQFLYGNIFIGLSTHTSEYQFEHLKHKWG